MRQSLLILFALLILAITTSADAQIEKMQIQKIYADYLAQKNKFFRAIFDKKNIQSKVQGYVDLTKAKLKEIQLLESKTNPLFLSSEGNQLALDIELIEPVNNLVHTNYSADECALSAQLNATNNENSSTDFSQIKKIIDNLCH